MRKIQKWLFVVGLLLALFQCNLIAAHAAKIPAPKWNEVKQTGAKRVSASWKKVSKATGYNLEYRVKGGKWKVVDTFDLGAVVSKLKVNKTYQFRVRAYKVQKTKKTFGKYSAVKKLTIKKKVSTNALSAEDMLFDWQYYVNKYADLKKAYGNNQAKLKNHWITYGKKEGRVASELFDAKYYLNKYPDLKNAYGNDYRKAYDHFVVYGIKEGRQGSASFNIAIYKTNYYDLRAAFGNNNYLYYQHWREYGKREGRNATTSNCGNIPNGWYTIATKSNVNYVLDIAGAGTQNGANLGIHQKNNTTAQKFFLNYNVTGHYYTIMTGPTNKYLHVENGTKKNTNVHQWSGINADAQWDVVQAGGGYYYLRNRANNAYLDNAGGIVANGNNVQTYDLNYSNAQKWKFTETTAPAAPPVTPARTIADGWYMIATRNNEGYVLDVAGGGTANQTNVWIFNKSNSSAQRFYLTYNSSGGYYTMRASHSGKYVHIQDENNKTSNVHQWEGSGKNAHWFLESAGSGYYYLRNEGNGSYLDNSGGIAQLGNNVQSYPLNRSNAQQWKFIATSNKDPDPVPVTPVSSSGGEKIFATARLYLGQYYPYFDGKGFHWRAWCADFVSLCASQSGQSYAVPSNASVKGIRTAIVSAGGKEYSKATVISGGYVPVRGDIIIFLSNGDSHVGIVDYASGERIYYIDGNNISDGKGDKSKVNYSNRSNNYAGFTCVLHPAYK